MTHCHTAFPTIDHPELGAFTVITNLFLMGLSGSFIHCIGMCGPIALSQMSMRMMHLSSGQMKERHKISTALALPYYTGKALTYVLLTLLIGWLANTLEPLPYIRYLATAILLLTSMSFLYNASLQLIPNIHYFMPVILHRFLTQHFSGTWLHKFSLAHPFGLRGLGLGMMLGLIPCGLVYNAIITALALSANIIIATIAVFGFGIATIPGLFMVAYLGQHVLAPTKRYFRWVYSAIMAGNAIILLYYAITLQKW